MLSPGRDPLGHCHAASLIVLLTATASLAASVPAGTTLELTVLDPVSLEPVAGAEVRLVNEVGVTGAGGLVHLHHRRHDGRPLWTGITASGYAPYATWTQAGHESFRDVYLFPASPIAVPGRATSIDPDVFARHFDVVYRDPEAYGRLIRWMEQPEIVLVNRTVETRDVAGGPTLVTTRSLVGPRIRRRIRRGLRRALGPLTGGFLHAERPRIRTLPAGYVFDPEAGELLPRGELVIYVQEGPDSSAATLLEGSTIVGGAAWLATSVLRQSDHDYAHRVLIHEIGHTVGMFHPASNDNRTPLCSIISYWPCSWFTNLDVVTPIDRITGRLAYSRLPGNEHADTDPRPEAIRGRARAGPVLVVSDAPADALRPAAR